MILTPVGPIVFPVFFLQILNHCIAPGSTMPQTSGLVGSLATHGRITVMNED